MRTMRWWWGMLCVAGMACGDEGPLGAPRDAAVPGVATDLNFVFPAVKGSPAAVQSAVASHAPEDLTDVGGGLAADVGEGTAPLIWSTSVKVAFEGKTLPYEYGMTGFGSGYSMTPRLTVRLAEGGTVDVPVGAGLSEDLFFGWRFKPKVSRVAGLQRDCGMHATLHVQFEARMAGRVVNTSREQKLDEASAIAPPCPPGPTTGSGTSGSGPTYYLTICSYELWVDLDGNLIAVIPLGCSTVALPQMQ